MHLIGSYNLTDARWDINFVIGTRAAAIPDDASGAANQATVNLILAALRANGIVAP